MTDRTEGNCPMCGMDTATGSNPTTRDGKTYCCEGCANGGDCTCSQHDHAASSSAAH